MYQFGKLIMKIQSDKSIEDTPECIRTVLEHSLHTNTIILTSGTSRVATGCHTILLKLII